MESRLADVLADELKVAEARATAIVGQPITINSALDRRKSGGPVTPTVNRAAAERPSDEDDGEPWADEAREAAMQAAMEVEDAEREAKAPPPSRRQLQAVETLDGGPLPPLDDLIARVPADLQEKMEDLFRAKFQTVKRIPAAVLKPGLVAENPHPPD